MHQFFKKAHLILALSALIAGGTACATEAEDVAATPTFGRLSTYNQACKQAIRGKYNLLPPAVRDNMEHYGIRGVMEIKACHEEVSSQALSAIMRSWTWCMISENNERAYMGSAVCGALIAGGHAVPGFVGSALCCVGMTAVCAATASESREVVTNMCCSLRVPFLVVLMGQAPAKKDD